MCFFFCQKSLDNKIQIFIYKIVYQKKYRQSMARIVFHIDVNSAFLSWSAKQVLEQWYKTDLREIVSVVWVEEKRKGIVAAASIPAKKLWIKAAMRIADARKIFPWVKVAPPDYTYYKRCSDEMMNLLKNKFKLFQQYSIDECFAEYTEDMQNEYWDSIDIAYQIKDYIKKKCWFTVNVWVWNNKFLAKMASDFEKPDKVHTLFSYEIKDKMWPLPIREMFGCWKKTEIILKELWIETIWDLAQKDKALIKLKIWRYWWILRENANWIDDTKLENNYDDRKNIWSSSITKIDTKDRDYILTFFKWFAEVIALSLEERGLAWDILTVHIRYTDFSIKSHQSKLPNSINTPEEIYNSAVSLFDELWNGKEVNLVWITIWGLHNIKFKQDSLF